MKFTVSKTSSWSYREEKEIATLEELLAFCKEVDCEIIVKEDGSLEIYDDYRE